MLFTPPPQQPPPGTNLLAHRTSSHASTGSRSVHDTDDTQPITHTLTAPMLPPLSAEMQHALAYVHQYVHVLKHPTHMTHPGTISDTSLPADRCPPPSSPSPLNTSLQ